MMILQTAMPSTRSATRTLASGLLLMIAPVSFARSVARSSNKKPALPNGEGRAFFCVGVTTSGIDLDFVEQAIAIFAMCDFVLRAQLGQRAFDELHVAALAVIADNLGHG